MTCKVCGAETAEDCCSDDCRRALQCRRIAWDRTNAMCGTNGYYQKRYNEHLRNNNKHGAMVMLKEWKATKEKLGERP